jgi:hypothetical protein
MGNSQIEKYAFWLHVPNNCVISESEDQKINDIIIHRPSAVGLIVGTWVPIRTRFG